MSTFALSVLPGIIITDRGLLDGETQEFLAAFRPMG
jgi:adenine deaminase